MKNIWECNNVGLYLMLTMNLRNVFEGISRVNAREGKKVATGGLPQRGEIVRGRMEKKERGSINVSLVPAVVVESHRGFLLPSVVAIGRLHRTNYRLDSCSWVPSRVAWIGGEALPVEHAAAFSTDNGRHILYKRKKKRERYFSLTKDRKRERERERE